MKRLAKIIWNGFNDRKVWGFTLITFVAVAISTPANIGAASGTETSYGISLFHTYQGELASNLGLCPEETINGNEIICVKGALAETISAGNKSLSGTDFNSTVNALVALHDDPLNPEVVAEFNRINAGNRASLLGISQQATYALIDQKPASGLIYTDEVLAQVISPDTAYAQADNPEPYFPGTGFELLTPIRTIWAYLVGIAYSFMVILIVVVALALMFRARLSGDQAVQLQTAIPGIVMAMILIPLSYPISGLFIDGITLGSNAVRGFMFGPGGVFTEVYEGPGDGGGGLKDVASDLTEDVDRGLYIDDPRLSIFGAYRLLQFDSMQAEVSRAICGSFTQVAESSIDCGIFAGNASSANFIEVILGGLGNLIWSIVAELLQFAFNIFAFFVSLRIGWKLFKQFITMMILPITSPIVFATLAIPGRGNALVMDYLKRMGNVTANFITAYAMLLLASVFAAPAFITLLPDNAIGTLNNYQPPLIGGFLFGTANEAVRGLAETGSSSSTTIGVIMFMLAFGIFVTIPGILQQITDSLAPREENAFMKLFQAELGASSKLAFKQAPAVASTLAVNAYDKGVKPISTRIGARKSGPFDDSFADKFVKNQRESLAEGRRNASSKGFLRRNLISNPMNSVKERIADAGATALGKSGQFNTSGEKPAGITATVIDLTYASGGNGSFTVSKQQFTPTPVKFKGTVEIKANEGGPPPRGYIAFKPVTGGGSNGIGLLNNRSGGTPAVISIPNTISTALENGYIVVKDNAKFFAGGDKVKLDIEFTLPNVSTEDWRTDQSIEVAIVSKGLTDSYVNAKFDLRLQITP